VHRAYASFDLSSVLLDTVNEANHTPFKLPFNMIPTPAIVAGARSGPTTDEPADG
jgi:hypothetical protein